MHSVVNAGVNWQNSFRCRMRQFEVTKNTRNYRDTKVHLWLPCLHCQCEITTHIIMSRSGHTGISLTSVTEVLKHRGFLQLRFGPRSWWIGNLLFWICLSFDFAEMKTMNRKQHNLNKNHYQFIKHKN